MTQKTILNDTHRALGAKMVDFGGWDMPIHYGSQLDEHHLVRQAAGMFDVAHMGVVDLHGPSVRDFLRLLLANDIPADALHELDEGLPPMAGALLKNEQDLSLMQRLAAMSQRSQRRS